MDFTHPPSSNSTTNEDTFLTISEDLIPSAPLPSSTITTLSFSNLLNPPLRLQTNVSECGGQLWPAGMVLSEYLIRHHLDDMRGKTMFVRLLCTLYLFKDTPSYFPQFRVMKYCTKVKPILISKTKIHSDLNSAPAPDSSALPSPSPLHKTHLPSLLPPPPHHPQQRLTSPTALPP